MKYETPELTALTPAINAIQAVANWQEGPTTARHSNGIRYDIGALPRLGVTGQIVRSAF